MIKLEDHPDNYRLKNKRGKLNPQLFTCPCCDKPNHSQAVVTGACAWCGWHEMLCDKFYPKKCEECPMVKCKERDGHKQ